MRQMKLNVSFLIKDDKLLEKDNEISFNLRAIKDIYIEFLY